MGAEPPDELGRPEPRVHPEGQLAAGAGAAQPGHQLVNESEDAAGGVGRALAQPGVQHLAAVGAGGQQRMVAEPVGVAVAGALLVVAVHLADGGVHIHGQRPVPGAGARRPRPARTSPVTLSSWRTCPKVNARSHVPTVEAAITRWPSTLAVDPAAQQLHVIDAVATGDQGVDQGEQLAPGPGRPGSVAEVDELVGGLLDPQPLGQGCRQQQPGAGDGPRVIEGDLDLVQHHMRGWHRKGVLRLGDHDCLAAVILPGQGTLFTIQPASTDNPIGGFRLSG